jgi:hypothetical protein
MLLFELIFPLLDVGESIVLPEFTTTKVQFRRDKARVEFKQTPEYIGRLGTGPGPMMAHGVVAVARG